MDFGVPDEKLHLDGRATDTVTNFTNLVGDFVNQKIQHVYLITPDHHMRRSLLLSSLEDESRKRKGHSAQNFALLRKFVLSILRQDKSKSSVKYKRLKFGWDDLFLIHLLSKI